MGVVGPSPVRRRTILVEALRRPDLRRLAAISASFHVCELGAWIAVTTVAHQRGGVNEASAVIAAQLAPAALAALFVDRVARGRGAARVLAGGLAVQSLGLFALAIFVNADAASVAVYGAAILTSVADVTSRPTIAALLVQAADDPHELTAANAVVGWLDNAASFVGPGLTALAFALVGTAAPFVVFGGMTLVAALLALRVREGEAPTADEEAVDDDEPRSTWRDIAPVLAVLAGQAFVIGALDLLFVVVAIDITGGPPARAGWLNSMFGVGALIGASASVLLIGRRRIWPAVVVAGGLTTATLAVVGASHGPVLAAVVLAACGVGAAALSVSARTLLSRLSDLGLLCRAFSLAESFELAMLLVGTLTVPLLVSGLGARLAPLGVALVGAVVLLLAVRPMANAEARLAPPLERLAQLQAVELFRGLDAPTLETLARHAVVRPALTGTTVVRQGEHGADYFVVLTGSLSVAVDGRVVRTLEPGGGFGELALLHEVPRTATVVAVEDAELLVIDRRSFLVAVSGSPVATTYRHYPAGMDPLG